MSKRDLSSLALSRRTLLKAGIGLLLMPGLASCRPRTLAQEGEGGYGRLEPAGPELALPAGFTYRMFGVEGTIMSDGRPTPKAHDGMAAFPLPNGNIRLVRNHEDRDTPNRAVLKGDPSKAYDLKGPGGTTSLEIKPTGDRELVKDFVSLSGTIVNCAGGPTPWGSWLSCEESTEGTAHGWSKDHGFVYDVPAEAEDEVVAVPLEALGRFVHEAVALDPSSGIVYETEDRPTAGFYRFIPERIGDLTTGRLQMLAVKGYPNFDTSTGQQVGTPLAAEWVDIDDPTPAEAGVNPAAVFQQGQAKGAAIFSRLEGCWFGRGSVFFHATDGGDAGLGQVWEYRPLTQNEGQLILFFESPGRNILNKPDNITLSPRGGILICEDGWGTPFLRGLTPEGKIFDFAKNLKNNQEFAGATFSPDGQTLFVNIQGDTSTPGFGHLGMTFAIWGPWTTGAL